VDSDGDNRRRQQRFTVQLTSVLVGGNADPEHSMLVNLSAGGVYVRTANPPPIGAQVGIEFTLLGKRTCSAAGQVVWRAETGRRAGFGIEFDHANDNMQRFIASLGRLPTHLRPIYLADVTLPQIETP
jgi:Tfp pilus assembly protein PilZ